jgi:hypothetical protein
LDHQDLLSTLQQEELNRFGDAILLARKAFLIYGLASQPTISMKNLLPHFSTRVTINKSKH